MKRFLLSILAIFLPWATFLIVSRPLAALAALALQLSFIGWPVAIIWAWSVIPPLKKAPPTQVPNEPTLEETVPIVPPIELKKENLNRPPVEKQVESTDLPPENKKI